MSASLRNAGWTEKIYQELTPTHGRYAGALRTAFAVTIAAFILLALRAPLIAPGLYLIYLVSYDVPYLTFRNSLIELTSQCVGVAAALLLIAATGDDPMARILGIAFFTFLSAFLLCACTRRSVAMNLGIFPVLTLTQWGYRLPTDRMLRLSMWPIATGALAVGCKVAIEYLFTRRDPQHALQREMEARVDALEQLFRLYGSNATQEELEPAIRAVSRFALSGQGKMSSLLEEISSTPKEGAQPFTIPPALIPQIARLLDLGATYGSQNPGPESSDGEQQSRFARLTAALAALRTGHIDEIEPLLGPWLRSATGLLGQLEQMLFNVGARAHAEQVSSREHEEVLTESSSKQSDSWFRTDALSNPEYQIYATKLSLCATICYVIYNALAWPGISTATLTVLVAGLSTTGATNQKMLFRIVGAVIGGVILGIGCIIFVYPYADTALPFLISVWIVSFIGAWVARSAHFGYVGLQIVFSFFLVVFQDFSATTHMTPGRDRVIGILLALLVMWMIFHQVHPQRAVDKMRHGLAQLLGIQAEALSLIHSEHSEAFRELRDRSYEVAGSVRALSEAIPFELDQHVERDLGTSDRIQEALATAGSLFLVTATEWPQEREISAEESTLISDTRKLLTDGLHSLSRMMEQSAGEDSPRATDKLRQLLEEQRSYPEFIANAVSFYSQLQDQCLKISNAARGNNHAEAVGARHGARRAGSYRLIWRSSFRPE